MKNYIQRLLRENKPKFYSHIDSLQMARIEQAKAMPMNSVLGSIEGEGTVLNCYIYGKVKIAKGAVLVNSTVDANVELEIGERAIVTDCSFHPTLLDRGLLITTIKIEDDSKLFGVWSSENLNVGKLSIVLMTMFGETGTLYNADAILGITIGPGSFIYGSMISARKDRGCTMDAVLTIGSDAFVWRTYLAANNGALQIGDHATFCDYLHALRIGLKGEKPALEITGNALPEKVANIEQRCSLTANELMASIGNDFTDATSMSLDTAFEKLKEHRASFGDNVSIVSTHPGKSRDHTVYIHIHSMEVGSDVTIITAGDSWYSRYPPVRTLTIGEGATWMLEASVSEFSGLDLKIPARAYSIV